MTKTLLNDRVFEEFRRHILPSTQDAPLSENMPRVTFPDDVIDQENVGRITRFFHKADSLDTMKLLPILNEVDKTNRVDPGESSTAEVEAAVVTFVEQILQKVGEIDPRFKSTLLRGGSFYDGVKIGKPDEFDFTAKIEALCLTPGIESRFSVRKKGFVYVVIKDTEAMRDFKDFFTDAEEDEILHSGDRIMSVTWIKEYFDKLVDKALKTIKAPEVLSPTDGLPWHSILHGPCAAIRATYRSASVGDMNLDIDIAPTFDLPPPHYPTPLVLHLTNLPCLSDGRNPLQSKLYEVLQRELKIMVVPFSFDKVVKSSDSSGWFHKYSETWRVSFNSPEKFVFSLYEFDSVEKQLYRVLKTMKESFIQKSRDLETKAGTSEMKLQEPPSTIVIASSITMELIGFDRRVRPIAKWEEESDEDTEDDQSASSPSRQNYKVLYERSSSPPTLDVPTTLDVSPTLDVPTTLEVIEEPKQGFENSQNLKTGCIDNENSISIDLKQESVHPTPHDVISFDPTQGYRDSQPLIKTYYIKMILFFMKLLLVDQKIWARENLPSLVLFVLKTFFFVYSSKERRFNNFWFQEMIEPVAWQSVGLEILQSLEDILEGLEEKVKESKPYNS